MMITRFRTAAFLGLLATTVLLTGGCGSSNQTARTNYDYINLAAYDMTAVPGNALAASDSIGAIAFGPQEVRDQFAMLRNSADAFARAESRATEAAMTMEFATVEDNLD